MREEKDVAEPEPEDFAGILGQLNNYLYEYYAPVREPKDADFHFTTKEIWEQLIRIFPNELILTQAMVASWLHEGGFIFYDFGKMRLEWLVKKKK